MLKSLSLAALTAATFALPVTADTIRVGMSVQRGAFAGINERGLAPACDTVDPVIGFAQEP